MKKNLEIPPTFKGKSFPSNDYFLLASQAVQVGLSIGNNNDNMFDIIEELKVQEQKKCIAFANDQPEVVLPASIDLAQEELVGTPASDFSVSLVGTADDTDQSPAVLTKVKPCGLSHPFRIP